MNGHARGKSLVVSFLGLDNPATAAQVVNNHKQRNTNVLGDSTPSSSDVGDSDTDSGTVSKKRKSHLITPDVDSVLLATSTLLGTKQDAKPASKREKKSNQLKEDREKMNNFQLRKVRDRSFSIPPLFFLRHRSCVFDTDQNLLLFLLCHSL